MLNRLFRNESNDRETAEELRAVLHEMQQERSRYETLLESVRASVERLQQLGEPIVKAVTDVDAVSTRLGDVEERFTTIEQLSTRLLTLDERAKDLTEGQQRVQAQVVSALEDAQNIRSGFDEMSQKIELAVGLKDQLVNFLEVEKPFEVLKGNADALRGQVTGAGEHMVRLREQHDRLMDAHKLAMSKMEALDRRREELSRDMTDKERRVAGVEQAVRGMDGIQQTISDARREMASLKATADLMAQKTATLEAQRESVDRALAQADRLELAMRQIDAGVRQQQDNEKSLAALHQQVAALRGLHEAVVERSSEISNLQREIDERTQATRHDLSAVTEETKKTVDRFDFERRGMETVTQRVADLRAGLSDCESRFKGVNESSKTMAELMSHSQTLATRLAALSNEAAQVEQEMAKLNAIRRDLNDTAQTAREIGTQVTQIVEVRPALEAGLRDLAHLGGAHSQVKDALERTQVAHGELTLMMKNQAETRSWLIQVEQSLNELKGRAGELQAMGPTIEYVQQQTNRIGETMTAIETHREFVEDLHRRVTEIESLGGQIEERGQDLQTRMEAAEKRFVGLEAHAQDAERMTAKVAAVSSALNKAGREADEIKKTVTGIEARAESVEGLAEKTRALRKELEQRQHALAETTKDLDRTSELRQAAADSAKQLEELTQKLTAALKTADQRVTRAGELSTQLEDRAAGLRTVEKRLDEFEKRLTKWSLVDQNVARSLEEIASRQHTVGAMQADLDRMFAMAEKTSADVREITGAHAEMEESRALLQDVKVRLEAVRGTASTLEERKRQLGKAEERLARADGLLADVRSSLETLEARKSIVDQAVEKTGSLQFLLKKAEAAIEGLREERKSSARVRSSVSAARKADDADDEDVAKAA